MTPEELNNHIKLSAETSEGIADNLKITQVQVLKAVTLAMSSPDKALPEQAEEVLKEIACIYKHITDNFIELLQGNHVQTVACFHADYKISALEEQVGHQKREIKRKEGLLQEYVNRYGPLSTGEN